MCSIHQKEALKGAKASKGVMVWKGVKVWKDRVVVSQSYREACGELVCVGLECEMELKELECEMELKELGRKVDFHS